MYRTRLALAAFQENMHHDLDPNNMNISSSVSEITDLFLIKKTPKENFQGYQGVHCYTQHPT